MVIAFPEEIVYDKEKDIWEVDPKRLIIIAVLNPCNLRADLSQLN